jgi:hypothetical protein
MGIRLPVWPGERVPGLPEVIPVDLWTLLVIILVVLLIVFLLRRV